MSFLGEFLLYLQHVIGESKLLAYEEMSSFQVDFYGVEDFLTFLTGTYLSLLLGEEFHLHALRRLNISDLQDVKLLHDLILQNHFECMICSEREYSRAI